MYAIVDIAGQQFKVEEDQKIFVHRLEGEEGSKVDFQKVLLLDEDGKIKIGKPFVEKACVTATILSHLKGDKVTVFKKKRRKGYQIENGHRQFFSQIQIENIKGLTKKKAKVEPKAKVKETVVKEAVVEKKEEIKSE
jgi:large subunit ribosomal protein L21